jgi:phosphoglycerol geranylgeranyltransferase
MKFVYLEAGSGAIQPVPIEMISAVRKAIDIPLIVGGGIRDEKSALSALGAGANVIVTGTLIETSSNVADALLPIIKAVHSFQ